MGDFTFDERLFLWLNFDGGAVMDWIMSAVSGTLMWIPLYLFIAWTVQRKYGWQSLLLFVVCLALAMGISDMLCGIFKHTGLLKDVWADFPVRNRPMFDVKIRETIKLNESQVCNMPVEVYDKSCNAAIDYMELAKKIIEKEN